MSSQAVRRRSSASASKPVVCCSMKARSSTGSPPARTAASCASRTSFIMPFSAATSPPIRTWQYSLAIRVELNVAISIGSCGAANRSSARSRSGFIATIGTPRRDASCSVGHHSRAVGAGVLPDHENGVRLPRNPPAERFPCRSRCFRAGPTLVASWHMLEQSGKLLVPKRRTKS